MAELKTRDLIGVELLSAGGPIHGVGSPPEGDFWTSDDLRAMAAADAELGDELKPPNKIGHSDLQALVRNSAEELGLTVTPGEMPAVGWIENVRVNEDGTKLLGDIMGVPKKLAELLETGAWRTRSVELSKVTSQVTGKVYDWVVTGLAWLGGKMPAVRTLDDVVALYEQRGVELSYQEDGDVELRWIASYAAGDVVWSPTDGYEALRGAVSEALNGTSDMMVELRFWVRDVADGRALVEDWEDYDSRKAWIVPFTGTVADGIEIGDRGTWTAAEMGWLESDKSYEERRLEAATARERTRSDSRPVEPKYNDEQRRKFSETTGLELDKVTDEVLAAAAESLAVAPPKKEDEPAVEYEQRLKAFEEKLEQSDKRSRDLESELADERKRHFVDGVLKDGKAELGARAEVEAMYDASPESTRKFFETVTPNDAWAREYGSSDDGDPGRESEEDAEKRDLAEREQIARSYGLDLEDVA